MGIISFDANNQMQIKLCQHKHDANILVMVIDSTGNTESSYTIPPGAVVMLLNLYKHTMDNNIQNDFINPYGANKGD